MSMDAMSWAYRQKLKSSVKFVLVTLCDFANDDMKLWPSIKTICDRTCQDRKTVMAAIEELVKIGYLIDTGERKGATNQVKVFEVCVDFNGTKNGTLEASKSAENGTVKEYQKRNSTKNGTVPDLVPVTVPNFPPKSTKFPTKEYQISHQRVPNLVHGTINEPLIEPLIEPLLEPPANARAIENPNLGTETFLENENENQPIEIKKVERTRNVEISILMRSYNVSAQPANPLIIALANQDIDLATIEDACKEAQEALGREQRINPAYVIKILERWAKAAKEIDVSGAKKPKTKTEELKEFNEQWFGKPGERRSYEDDPTMPF